MLSLLPLQLQRCPQPVLASSWPAFLLQRQVGAGTGEPVVEPVRAATSALAPREAGAFLLQSPSLLQVPKARCDFLFLLSLLVFYNCYLLIWS